MGGAGSKGGGGDRPGTAGAAAAAGPPSAKYKGEPLLQQKFDSWKVAEKTEPGFGADEDDNQDVMLVKQLKNDVCLFSLFDGHGHEGRLAADAAKGCITEVLSENLTGENSTEGLKASFASLDKRVCADGSFDASESGCTATLVVYDVGSKQLLVGNVGDSKAVIGSGSTADGVCARVLTMDHYPSVAMEKQRIEVAGGRVAATDDVQLGELGGQRVWKGTTDKPGLPLSRSIGDTIAKEVGVISEPALKQVTLSADDRFMVLASGGVWKVFSPQEVIELVSKESDPAAAGDAVLAEASKRWEELWQGENTSIIVVAFPTS